MDKVNLSVFDKLLLECVFQAEQEARKKENTKECIKWYAAKCLQEKQQILELLKDIKSCEETILDLQKYSTAAIEEYHNQVNTCKEVFKQHQEKYMGFTLSKNYHIVKQELEEIQNLVLKHDEQFKTKERRIADALGPSPFASVNDWALHLAKVKNRTNEARQHLSEVSHTTLELKMNVNETELKIQCIKEHIENLAKQRKLNTQVKNQSVDSHPRIFSEERPSLNQSKEKFLRKLQLPNFPQKRDQPQKHVSFLSQSDHTVGKEEKRNNAQKCVSKVISQDESMEEDNQELLAQDKNENSAFGLTSTHHQVHFRMVSTQKQGFQPMDVSQTGDIRKEQTITIPDTSKDSGYCSQADSGNYEGTGDQSHGKVSEPEDYVPSKSAHTFAIPEASPSPAPITAVKSRGFNLDVKIQNVLKSSFESPSSPMDQTEQPSYFNLVKTSTPKTPKFGPFDSPFCVKFPDQHGSYSSADTNTSPTVKSFGSIFGAMEGDDDAFTFSFASKPASIPDEDDGFGFMLPFGQNSKPAKEPSQSKLKFTLF
ncbi:protein SIX6OS1 isoform X2 [Hyperolius riggenbachi]|uniref:protein SIX6OS1 isoform X2 n=1 Tax=Hyperolius riggenbachi TaxID=752182 RepID=UPI0035A3075C